MGERGTVGPGPGERRETYVDNGYRRTLRACYAGYIVQAVVNNFAPLLFVTFHTTYQIPMSSITLLITLNFLLQLGVDVLSAAFVDRIGYRRAVMVAHGAAACGLAGLAVLPELTPDPFVGMLLSVAVYALGGGLLEVLLSPIVEALPTENKEKTMSLLHSFYNWGTVLVVLVSTVFFALFGLERWKLMALVWALLPLCNLFAFRTAPICALNEDDTQGISPGNLARMPLFWVLLVVMACAGASEQSVSQWASTFAEQALGVDKFAGDLAGPMLFAVCMGLARLLYGMYGERLNLNRAMAASTLLCVVSYGVISLVPIPALSLAGCGICGFSVGILWPGTFSIAAAALRGGGTALFAFLALAGDLGCSLGPTFAGLVSGWAGGDLKTGILAAVVFPILLLVGIAVIDKGREHK